MSLSKMKSVKNFAQKPLHLVSINSFGKLVLHYDAIDYLKSLKSPLSILSIAGPYRTGKSFLLNSLIGTTENLSHPNDTIPIFQVGHTTNQTTHGLWIWSKPLLSYDQNNQITNVIVMDSQGYASIQSTHDKRLITLALLLSTCFLYNSKGVIDKDSLFDLQFVIEVARLISEKEEIKNSQQKNKRKCDFHWILRDFQLQLVNQLGHKITPSEYMENCFLQAEEKVSQSTIQTLRQYFPQRSCHTLCHPNTNQQVSEQRPQFISAILGLKQEIFKKKMKSLQMTGEQFVQLLQSYINAMNEGVDLQSVFQQGYDCRVRMDCLQKLLYKLKKLQKDAQHEQEIDSQLVSIKSQIKSFYHERMCSHKQIQALNTEVQQILNEYQQEIHSNIQTRSFIATSVRSSQRIDHKQTSVRCLDRSREKQATINNSSSNNNNMSQTNKHMLNIPRTTNRMARVSILCSQQDDRSFIIDEESIDIGRTSRIERRSAEKQKVSAQVKSLNNKIQQLQVKLHRTQLQLSTAQSQVTHLKEQLQALRHMLSQKEDQLTLIGDTSLKQKKHLTNTIQHLQQQLSQKQKQSKILQSQIQKITLLYIQKIEYLQRQLSQSGINRHEQFIQQKSKYKLKINQLTQQIKQMKDKHDKQTQSVRDIFKQQEMKLKSFLNIGMDMDSANSLGVFQQLQQILKTNQVLKQQLQQQKIKTSKLQSQLQTTTFKLSQKQDNSRQQLQQIQKRHLQNQSQLTSIYQSKLLSKQKQISQLQQKIKSLNQNIKNENKKLIESLKQMESHHFQQKEDLFVINSQLRNACLEALERVAGLKEQIEMKEQWIKQLQQQKAQLNKKVLQLKTNIQQNEQRYKQLQKQHKYTISEHIKQIQLIKFEQQHKLNQKDNQLKQLLLSNKQLEIQIDVTKHSNQQLTNKLSSTQQRIRHLQQGYHQLSQQILQKQHYIESMQQQKQQQITILKKQIVFINQNIQQLQQQKLQLQSNINNVKLQYEQKQQSLQVMYDQMEEKCNKKYQQQLKKYQQQLKQLKQQQQAKCNLLREDKQVQCSKLQQQIKSLQKQITQNKQQNQQLKQQLNQSKRLLQSKQSQLIQQQQQYSKQIIQLNHQIQSLQQQVSSQSNEQKYQQLVNRQQQLQIKIKQLNQINIEYEQQLQSKQQQINQQTHKHEQIITKLNQDNQTLQQTITQKQLIITQNYSNKTILQKNLLQLQQLIRVQQIQSQNHIRLYHDKLNKLKQNKLSLQKSLQIKKQQILNLNKEIKLTKSNYQSDFILWTKKFHQMESILKQAGYCVKSY